MVLVLFCRPGLTISDTLSSLDEDPDSIDVEIADSDRVKSISSTPICSHL